MDKILLALQHSSSQLNEALMWHWAMEHPYLYTMIEIAKPALILGVGFGIVNAVVKMIRR